MLLLWVSSDFKHLSFVWRYRCECQAGWEGQHCDLEKNECQSNPCQNGGTCVDRHNGYTCQCKLGFEGKRHRCLSFYIRSILKISSSPFWINAQCRGSLSRLCQMPVLREISSFSRLCFCWETLPISAKHRVWHVIVDCSLIRYELWEGHWWMCIWPVSEPRRLYRSNQRLHLSMWPAIHRSVMAHLLACNVTILSCCLDITLENISICMIWLLRICVKIGKHCEVEQVPCSSHPCKRGGVCHPTPDYTSFTCRCPIGWKGMCSSACVCVCAWRWLLAVILDLHF